MPTPEQKLFSDDLNTFVVHESSKNSKNATELKAVFNKFYSLVGKLDKAYHLNMSGLFIFNNLKEFESSLPHLLLNDALEDIQSDLEKIDKWVLPNIKDADVKIAFKAATGVVINQICSAIPAQKSQAIPSIAAQLKIPLTAPVPQRTPLASIDENQFQTSSPSVPRVKVY